MKQITVTEMQELFLLAAKLADREGNPLSRDAVYYEHVSLDLQELVSSYQELVNELHREPFFGFSG